MKNNKFLLLLLLLVSSPILAKDYKLTIESEMYVSGFHPAHPWGGEYYINQYVKPNVSAFKRGDVVKITHNGSVYHYEYSGYKNFVKIKTTPVSGSGGGGHDGGVGGGGGGTGGGTGDGGNEEDPGDDGDKENGEK